MAKIIEMPKLSPTMESGKIARWLKKEGDSVKEGDVLCEVETDKATVECQAYDKGTLLKIFKGEGEDALVGKPIAVIGKPGESFEDLLPKKGAPEVRGAPDKALDQTREISASEAAPKEAFRVGMVFAPIPPRTNYQFNEEGGSREIRISPRARSLAIEKGLDPTSVKGSGPGGRILASDLDNASKKNLSFP